MKVALYYFSGTGNTERVALLLKEAFGPETEVYRLRYPFNDYPNPNDFALIGFGYPIHAFNAPEVMNRFAKGFPIAKKKMPYFIFKTSGEPLHLNDCSSRKMIHNLRKKGYSCVQEFHYITPYNMVFRHSNPMAKKMWDYAKRMVSFNVKKVLSGAVETPHFRPLQGWYIVPFRIEWPFAKTNGRYFKVDYSKCVHCKKCVNGCPMGNITIKDGKLVFANRCSLCMYCSFSCPRKAIVPGMFKHKWFINGAYDFDGLDKDENVIIPAKSHEKHFNHSYDKYFAMCDGLLEKDA